MTLAIYLNKNSEKQQLALGIIALLQQKREWLLESWSQRRHMKTSEEDQLSTE